MPALLYPWSLLNQRILLQISVIFLNYIPVLIESATNQIIIDNLTMANFIVYSPK